MHRSRCAMSAVTKQPLPCGRLEREKHIETFFRAFHHRSRPPHDPQGSPGAGPRREPPGWEAEEGLSGLGPGRPWGNGIGLQQRSGQSEEDEDGLQMDSMAALESASQLHVTARPDLQGKYMSVCVCVCLCVSVCVFSVCMFVCACILVSCHQ